MTAELALRNGHNSTLTGWASEAQAAAGIARALATTPFVPDSLRVKDSRGTTDVDATVAQVAAALLTGQELGLSPMASLRSIDIIHGTPALRAATLRALVQQAGHSIVVIESTASRAVVRARRLGDGQAMDATWTMDRAERMKLRNFGNPDGPWRRQPANMLLARATAEASRWVASDAILGLYTVEEIEDADDTTTTTDAGPGDIPGPPVPPQRQRTAQRRTPPAGRPSSGPLPPPPPAHHAGTPGETEAAGPAPGHGEQDPDDNRAPSGEPSPETGPAAPPITPAQSRKLHLLLRRAGIDDRDVALGLISQWVGRTVDSTKNLTETEASRAIVALDGDPDLTGSPERQPAVNEPLTPDTPGGDPA